MKKIILTSLFIVLTAIKCAPEILDVKIENNTNDLYYFTCFSNINEIKNFLSHSQMDDQDVFFINKNINYLEFIEPSLYFYKRNEKYVFYFIKEKNYNLSKPIFDSISIPCEELDIDKKIIFTINKDKILLKNE
jgi:hypothetical protein